MRNAFPTHLLVLAALSLGTLASAQAPGTVLSHKKFSKTAGQSVRPTLDQLDQFGRSVALIGDLDGDGVAEIAVGAHGDDDGGSGTDPNIGALWILFMQSDGSTKSISKISATQGGFTGDLDNNDGFGRAAARLGDFDGDGVPDLMVGANNDDDGGNNRGAVYFLYLTAQGTVKSHTKISATQGWAASELDNGDEFGRGMAVLGDLDGNGVPDIVVGATNDDDGDPGAGALYVLFMNADGSVLTHTKISEGRGGFTGNLGANFSFGMSVDVLGDVNGNGITDLIVGMIGDNTGGTGTGAAYVLMLRADGSVEAHHKISASSGDLPGELDMHDETGFGVAGPGDVDGDGVPDAVLGALLDDDGVKNAGAVYVLFLASDGSVKSYQKISSTQGNFNGGLSLEDWWGCSTAALGDLDRDGFQDIAVGARFDDDGGNATGSIFLLFLQGGSGSGVQAGILPSAEGGVAPLRVRFEDRSTGPVATRSWDFGDGQSSSESDPVHRYEAPGDYTVVLQVQSATGGSSSTSFPIQVTALGAGTQQPYGCDDLVAGSLTVQSGSAAIGSSLTFGIHNPLGTQAPGSLTGVHFALTPDALFPCGSSLAGFGMSGAGAAGELLIGRAVLSVNGPTWDGSPTEIAFAIPALPVLAGLTLYVQGLLIDPAADAAVPFALTDALEVQL